jgi:peptidoglycan/xylan/chitin deacetylase (PgdA/CDA1 family)
MKVVPILLYHSVGHETSGPLRPYTTTPEAFRDQMAWVADEGYTTLTVHELQQALEGTAPLPPRPLVITFDDGLADFARHALPVLADHGHRCTMFVTTAVTWHSRPMALGGRTTLSRSEVAGLPGLGVEVGGHSHDHLQLDLLPTPRVASQVRVCKDQLEQTVGGEVTSFAYPHGYFRSTTRRLVREAGFTAACAVKNRLSHEADDPWALARVMLTADQSVPFLRRAIGDQDLPTAGSRERPATTAWRAARFVRTGGRPLVDAGPA